MRHTKQEFQAFMLEQLNALTPFYRAHNGRVSLSGAGVVYDKTAQELEGFARPLWALAPFWHGGGKSEAFAQRYRQGLAAGTDPVNEAYWGKCQDYDQRFVEMAAIASGLMLAPEILWDPLSQAEKEKLAVWLGEINLHAIPECNWHFYRILVNEALKKRGCAYREDCLQSSRRIIESYYTGGGWYRDGKSGQKDYYAAFAMQYYALLYAVAIREEDPAYSALLIARAEEFAKDFIYWFDDSGACVPWGRSLIYRYAHVAFWSACLYAGVTGIPVGVIKGIIERNLAFWEQQNARGTDGVFSVGYAYPNLILAERYNSPCSPYWCMKAFLFLALPDAHPFWHVPAEPLPELDSIRSLPNADMLVSRGNGHVTVYPAGICELYGHGHAAEKYGKFAYSSYFGFSVAHSQMVLHENAPDSMLAFVLQGDDYVYVRKKSIHFSVRPGFIESEWSPLSGITVRTTITPTKDGHIRHHRITSAFPCTAYDCGFSVPAVPGSFLCHTGTHTAQVETDTCFCRVESTASNGEPFLLSPNPNTNILYPNTCIPAVRWDIPKGTVEIETIIRAAVKKGLL